MATQEELQAKSDATRLRNLLARKAVEKSLSPTNEALLRKLKAKAKTKTPRKERRDSSQIAWGVVQHVTGAERNWFIEPASPKWTGRKIKNKGTGREYVIRDVYGELHVELERDAKVIIRTATSLRENYEPI